MAKDPQISSFTNLRGLDGEVQKIQSLMSFTWTNSAFGLAETGFNDKPFPMAFNTNTSDEQDLRPNDRWGSYCFFTYSDEGAIDYPEGLEWSVMRKGKSYVTYPVSCIFYMKLPSSSNYKVTKTQRRQEIWEFFDTLIGYAGAVKLTGIVDHDIKEVFEGFDLGEFSERWFYLPYYGVRFNMELTFRNYCA